MNKAIFVCVEVFVFEEFFRTQKKTLFNDNFCQKTKTIIFVDDNFCKKQKRKLTSKTENDEDVFSSEDAEGDENSKAPVQEGSDLIVRNLNGIQQFKQTLINKYFWSENGKLLLLESSASKSNKNIKPKVYIWRTNENRFDTILTGGNDFRNFAIDKNPLARSSELPSHFYLSRW